VSELHIGTISFPVLFQVDMYPNVSKIFKCKKEERALEIA
jgi:hypothetical protein